MFDTPDDFLPERRPNNNIYLSIYEGKLCQRRAKETPGFTRYESVNPKTRGKVNYIREFDHISGLIVGFERRDKETVEGLKYVVIQVTFTDGRGHKAILEVPVRSEFVARFAKCVENMNLTKPVWMRAFLSRDGSTGVYFQQEGAKVAQKYTKDQPNGLPEWKKDPITNEYDTRDYWAFLFRILSEHAVPQINLNRSVLESMESDQGTTPQEAETEAPPYTADDDIPF